MPKLTLFDDKFVKFTAFQTTKTAVASRYVRPVFCSRTYFFWLVIILLCALVYQGFISSQRKACSDQKKRTLDDAEIIMDQVDQMYWSCPFDDPNCPLAGMKPAIPEQQTVEFHESLVCQFVAKMPTLIPVADAVELMISPSNLLRFGKSLTKFKSQRDCGGFPWLSGNKANFIDKVN